MKFPFRAVCVGPGPIAYKEELKALTRHLEIETQVEWTETTANMDSLYQKLDLCCLFSFAEGFPNAVIEALANAVPCLVAEEAGDAPRIVADEFVARSRNPKDLAMQIQKLWQAGSIRRDYHLAELIRSRYSVSIMVQATRGILLGLTGDVSRNQNREQAH